MTIISTSDTFLQLFTYYWHLQQPLHQPKVKLFHPKQKSPERDRGTRFLFLGTYCNLPKSDVARDLIKSAFVIGTEEYVVSVNVQRRPARV